MDHFYILISLGITDTKFSMELFVTDHLAADRGWAGESRVPCVLDYTEPPPDQHHWVSGHRIERNYSSLFLINFV